jgi:hypothetical protein
MEAKYEHKQFEAWWLEHQRSELNTAYDDAMDGWFARAQLPASPPSVSVDEVPITLMTALNFFNNGERLELWKQFNCSDSMLANITRAVLLKQRAEASKAQPVAHAAESIELARAAYHGGAPAVSLVAQLLGHAPCEFCGYHHAHCRCKAQPRTLRDIGRLQEEQMAALVPVAEKTCFCQKSDAWRCAVDRGMSTLACHCECHKRGRIAGKEQP